MGWAIFRLYWLCHAVFGCSEFASSRELARYKTVWMIRLTSTLLIAAAILVSKQPVRLPRGEVRWMVLGHGPSSIPALFVLSNLGMKMEQVAVISVLGSLYGAVTVGLAAIFLKRACFRAGSGWESQLFSWEFFSSAGKFLSSFLHSLPRFSAGFPRTDTLHGGDDSSILQWSHCRCRCAPRFTYAIPEALQGTVQAGSRVLVPFRKKSMVGVVVEMAESAPHGTNIREISRVIGLCSVP